MRRRRLFAPVVALTTALLLCISVAAAMAAGDEVARVDAGTRDLSVQSAPDVTVAADSSWGDARPQDVQAVLSSVATVVLRNFPGRRLQPIVVAHSDLYPITLFRHSPNDEYRVFLAAKDRYWARYVYEFAHELSHILSNYDQRRDAATGAQSQWFEEALCEIASLHALKGLAAEWEHSPPYPNWAPYAQALDSYAENMLNEAHRALPPSVSLAAWFRSAEAQLQANPYLRKYNEVAANALLPLFEQTPAMWRAVGYLNINLSGGSFKDYLSAWRNNVPDEYRAPIAQIAALFGLSSDESAASLSDISTSTVPAEVADY